MPILTDIDDTMFADRRAAANAAAKKIPLVHVDPNLIELINQPPHEIPTYASGGKSDDTKRTEDLLGLSASSYFYAGRACPDFGNTAFAFAADCEADHTGSASPYDTGGLLSDPPHLKIRLNPGDGKSERVAYGKATVLKLDRWRETFGTFLAAYFKTESDYWYQKPNRHDPEGLIELNHDWRAWTFEIRFYEGQTIHTRVAWCADESVMEKLRRLSDITPPTIPGDPPSLLDLFFTGPDALAPAGTMQFCSRLERWAQEHVTA